MTKPRQPFKNQNGIVYTPEKIAKALVQYVEREYRDSIKSVLEPSAGDGVFLDALESSKLPIKTLHAVDKSKRTYTKLTKRFPLVNNENMDFLEYAVQDHQKKFDLVIGNPPFVRHSNMTTKGRRNVAKLKRETPSIQFSLKNLWAAFLVAAVKVSASNGVLAFILPYELLKNEYGRSIQKWIIDEVGSLKIFISKHRAFDGIDQDAVIAIIDRRVDNRELGVVYLNDLSEISQQGKTAKVFAVDPMSKLSLQKFLLSNDALGLIEKLACNLPQMSELCSNSTGIVTGANQYFIGDAKELKHHGVFEYSVPIIQKSDDLGGRVVITENLETSNAVQKYVIDFTGFEFEDLSDFAQRYIDLMRKAGVSQRYKCRKRPIWYQAPILDATPLYFFKRSHRVVRLVRNYSTIRVTDTAYRVTPNAELTANGLFCSFYNSLNSLFCEIEGRFYGGGVLELTPNEFRKLPVAYWEPNNREFTEFRNKIDHHAKSGSPVFSYGDSALRQRLQLSEHEIGLIRSSFQTLQTHRLRHGSVE